MSCGNISFSGTFRRSPKNSNPSNADGLYMKKSLLLVSQGKIPYQVEKQVREKYADHEWTEILGFSFSISKIAGCIGKLLKKHSVCIFYIVLPLSYFKKFILSFLFLFSRAGKKIILEGNRQKVEVTAAFYISSFLVFPLCLVISFFSFLFSIFWIALFRIMIRKPNKLKEKSDSKKIACIYTQFVLSEKVGGHVSHVKGVVDGFSSLGYKPIIYSSGKIGHLEGDYRIIDVPLRKFLPRYIAQMLYNLTVTPTIYTSIKKEKLGFIYQRHGLFNVSGAFLSHLTGLPLILEVNAILAREQATYGRKHFLSFLVFFCEKISFNAAHRVLSITEKLKEELIEKGVDKERIFVNPNGVDTDIFKPGVGGEEIREKFGLQDKVVVGFSGTFAVWHGTETLKAAAIKVLSEYPQSAFIFIGDGPEKNQIEKSLREKFSDDRFIFTGMISPDKAPAYLDACDILISPIGEDKANSSPIKIFEYMAAAKAIVCYDVGQMSEILENEETALLVPDGDIEGFIEAVVKLINDPGLRESMGKKARETAVSKYTWMENTRKIIENYEQLYDKS